MTMIINFVLGRIPAPYRLAAMAIAAAVVLGSAYATGRSHGSASVKADWDADKVARAVLADQAEQESRNRERAMQQQLNEAQHAAAEREQKLRADYAAAHAAALSLRDTVATLRGRVPGNTAQANSATADTALAVFGECAARLGALAAAADGHASDAQLCRDAWPE